MSSLARGPRTGLFVVAGLMTLAWSGAGLAADAPKARASQLQAIVDCRQVADPAQRLACYDAAAGALDAAEKSGEVVVVDRAQVSEARRAAFGFNITMPAFMTGGEKADPIEQITATVASARQNGERKWVMTMTDGAVWRQTDTEWVSRDPKAGTVVEIRAAALGSFVMTVGGTRIRVHRDN